MGSTWSTSLTFFKARQSKNMLLHASQGKARQQSLVKVINSCHISYSDNLKSHWQEHHFQYVRQLITSNLSFLSTHPDKLAVIFYSTTISTALLLMLPGALNYSFLFCTFLAVQSRMKCFILKALSW